MANELSPQKSNLPQNVDLSDFNAVGGTGFENVKPTDLLIPRLTILQGLSPQVIKGKPEYDPDARVGDIYDTGLRERFPDGIEVVVADFKKAFVEWLPERGQSNAPIAVHEDEAILDEAERDKANNKLTLPNGNVIAETMQFYVLNLTAGRRKSFLPMASTMLKNGKQLLTLAEAEKVTENGVEKKPPLFWRSYFLTTQSTSNAKGTWMSWKIQRGPKLIDMADCKLLLKEVKDLRDAVIEGRARGDLGHDEDGGGDRDNRAF